MKLLLSLLLSLFTMIASAQQLSSVNPQIERVKTFVARLNNPELATDVILSQDITVQQQLTDDYLDYLLESVDEVRINIQNKDLQQLEYLTFLQAGKKETRDIDLEDIDANNVVFVRFQKRFVFAAVVEKNKISSFTLVAKGNNMAHFVRY